jgi:3-methyladenine DNA glycosylase AlkD
VTDVQLEPLLRRMRSLGSRRNVLGMARYGIRPARAFGLPAAEFYRLSREIGRDHALARRLWATGIHDARVLAILVEDPERVSSPQMDRWAKDFDSWAACDGACLHLFDRTPFARRKVREWSRRGEEFVKRAAFALMAALAVHDKQAPDALFLSFLRIVARESDDERNGVRKAVNWALRQIGKRNPSLNGAAIRAAEGIRARGTRAARWIAADALRELRSEAVQRRLRLRARRSGARGRRSR